MNCWLKIILCFNCFFHTSPESLLSKILSDFDDKQERDGYEFLWRMVKVPDKFHGYMLQYYGFKTMNQDQARRHLITNLEGILSSLNSEKRIEDSLYRYPLMPGDITLLYVNFEAEDVIAKKPMVSSVSNNYTEITYKFSTNENIDDDEVVTESYNEAYEKVFGKPREPLCEPKKSPN